MSRAGLCSTAESNMLLVLGHLIAGRAKRRYEGLESESGCAWDFGVAFGVALNQGLSFPLWSMVEHTAAGRSSLMGDRSPLWASILGKTG